MHCTKHLAPAFHFKLSLQIKSEYPHRQLELQHYLQLILAEQISLNGKCGRRFSVSPAFPIVKMQPASRTCIVHVYMQTQRQTVTYIHTL